MCSNGSQARAIWESQPPLRGRCTNTSIVLLHKSLPLVVTPCVTQPQQHSSALTQLDINSRLWSCCLDTRNKHGMDKHPQIISQKINIQHEEQEKRLPISSGLSIQQSRCYIIPLGTMNSTKVHRLTITTKVTVIHQYYYYHCLGHFITWKCVKGDN